MVGAYDSKLLGDIGGWPESREMTTVKLNAETCQVLCFGSRLSGYCEIALGSKR